MNELNVVAPDTAPDVLEMISRTTWRNAFEYGLKHEESRYNMLAWCEEYFDLGEAHMVWEMTHDLVGQIKRMREAMK